jgi:hypothetical protein
MQPKSPLAKFIDSLTELTSNETDPTKKEIYTHMLDLARVSYSDIADVETQFDQRIADLEQDLKYNR